MHPTLKPEILALIESKILAGKKPTDRTDMVLGQILVLGVVRLGLEVDNCVQEADAHFPTDLSRLLAFMELL